MSIKQFLLIRGEGLLLNPRPIPFENNIPRLFKTGLLIPLIFAIVVPFVVSNEGGETEKTFPPQAIFAAAYRGDVEMVQEILAAGVDKDARNGFGDTALHVAIFQENLAVLRLLLDYGFDPNAIATRNGHTPLHNAVATDNVEAARLLLQYRANRNIRDLNRLTPLEKARREGKRDLVMILSR